MYQFDSRIRYSEVNSERNLTLPALLDYLQDCCIFQSEELSVGVDYLKSTQAAWVLSSWEIEILRNPKLGEYICVKTWPYDFKGFYGYRNFLIETKSGEVLAKANSVWVFMDTCHMRPARITKTVVNAYQKEIGEPLEGTWSERKIMLQESGVIKDPVQIARFHIDTNHHMNNEKYVQVAEEYLPEQYQVRRLRVEYKKAAVFGDILYPTVIEKTDQIFVVLADAHENPYAIVQFFVEQHVGMGLGREINGG